MYTHITRGPCDDMWGGGGGQGCGQEGGASVEGMGGSQGDGRRDPEDRIRLTLFPFQLGGGEGVRELLAGNGAGW